MSLSRKACLAGVYEHPTRFAPDKSMFQIAAESIRGALHDCGLTIKDVDGLAMTGIGIGGINSTIVRRGKSMPNASRTPKIAPDAPTVG